MKKSTAVKEAKINLRDLDDTACTNVVVSRQIRRFIRKFPSAKDFTIDCWAHGGHYTRFESKDDKFIWYTDKNDKLVSTDDSLTKEELNKLIVFTYQAMCDSQSEVDLIDTPEDLLAYAETKLQELLKEENTDYDDSTMTNQEIASISEDSRV